MSFICFYRICPKRTIVDVRIFNFFNSNAISSLLVEGRIWIQS